MLFIPIWTSGNTGTTSTVLATRTISARRNISRKLTSLLWYHYNAYHLFAISARPIYPGALYYSNDLKRAIQQTTQHEPLLVCKNVRVGKIYIWYLLEVIICFDQLGNNVVPCGTRHTNCPAVRCILWLLAT